MKDLRKHVTVMVVPEGTQARLAWRLPIWLLYLLIGVEIILIVGILVFFVFYGKIVARAAMTEQVLKENEALLRYRYKVQLLEANLNEAREFVGRMATMAGVDYEFPEMPDDSSLFAKLDEGGRAVVSRGFGKDWTVPSGLPVRGFITQAFEIDDKDHYHPGVDVACAVGTPVLATAAGMVTYADFDSTYGYMLIIRHNDSLSTVYGHNDSLLVKTGQPILAGARVALSGNTGKSTAPHLHYELRLHEKPINPLDSRYDEENRQQ